jgi:hypothetical protein
VTHTQHQPQPWWEVDLGAPKALNRIVIFNRTDGDLEHRLRGLHVSVLDDARQVVWQRQMDERPGPQITIHLSPMPVELTPSCVQPAAQQMDKARHVTVVITEQPVGFANGTVFEVRLTCQGAASGADAKLVRLSATTMESPIHDIPPAIADIIKDDPSDRSPAAVSTLAAFYRSIAPDLQPTRARIDELRSELRRVE